MTTGLPVASNGHTLIDTVGGVRDDVVEFIGHTSRSRHIRNTTFKRKINIYSTWKFKSSPEPRGNPTQCPLGQFQPRGGRTGSKGRQLIAYSRANISFGEGFQQV